MISVTSPLWFLGLCLIPAIWWLHHRSSRQQVKVVAAFLWQDAAYTQTLKSTQANKEEADPIWKLRATTFALLCFALCGPYIPAYQENVNANVDTAKIHIDTVTIRRARNAKDRILVKLTLTNIGDRPQSAIVDLSVQDKTVISHRIDLPPNQNTSFTETLSATASDTLQVQLQTDSGQPAAVDIPLVELQPLLLRITDKCPTALTLLLDSLNEKQIIEFTSTATELNIVCQPMTVSHIASGRKIPSLVIAEQQHPQTITEIPYWKTTNADLMSLQLAPEWFKVAAISPEPDDQWLLASANIPLIIQRRQKWHLLFDLNEPALHSQPAFPLLVMAILQLAAPQYKLDPGIVRAFSRQSQQAQPPDAAESSNINASHWPVVVILLLILVSLMFELLLSQWQREPHR